MSRHATFSPDYIPVLARGKHRTPKSGACFMEFASFLAGERWSDHPECTDGTLGMLARGVNDSVGNTSRDRLVRLIPSVVGLRGPDDTVSLIVAIIAGTAALPVANESRQKALAAGLLLARDLLPRFNDELATSLGEEIRRALDLAPAAETWAERFRRELPPALRQPRVLASCRMIVVTAVAGVAEACVPDTDERLVSMLERAIETCATYLVADQSLRTTTPERVMA
jgi:hypothetical protein